MTSNVSPNIGNSTIKQAGQTGIMRFWGVVSFM
jgi:hypothetical protein